MAARHRIFGVSLLALACTIIGLCACSRSALAAAPSYSEEEVEAAFLYRFVGFVRWPPSALSPAVFTVAVLDDDPMAGNLERLLSGNELQGRPAQVRRITSIEQLGNAQILYIGAIGESTLKRSLALLAGRPVLVVTRQPGALEEGSTINFLVLDRHVRFEIALAAAQRAGLNISAELLSVATRVEGGPMGSEMPCKMALPGLRPRIACPPRLAAK